jgi:hypothetical protein
MHPEYSQRRGSVLILIAGMAALLLTMAVAVLAGSRSLNEASDLVLAEARNRVILAGALMYLQESSQLGWGGGPGDMAFGWTDVRDGSIGPRGRQRDSSGNPQTLGWSPGGGYPAPGGAMRGDMFAWELPPYAILPDVAINPFQLADADAERGDGVSTGWEYIIEQDPPVREWNDGLIKRSDQAEPVWGRAVERSMQAGVGAYTSQPVLDSYADFQSGDPRPRLESMGHGWFRIYRERAADCDGDGSPWYDTVPVAGSGTFIVTVGSGGPRGFRFWDGSTDYLNGRMALPAGSSGYSTQLEPVTASAAGAFASADTFAALRQVERVAWYRVQWVANSSDGFDPLTVVGAERNLPTQARFTPMVTNTERTVDYNFTPFYGGTIRWIQRLEQEPPAW